MDSSLEIHVLEEEEVPILARILLKEFKEVTLPNCLNYGNVAMVDRLMNTKPEEHKVHAQNDNYRILKGLIAPKLNSNPSLNEIIAIYERQMANRSKED